MPAIEGGRWDRTLRLLLGISDYGPAPELSPEIIPTLEVQRFEPDMYGLANEWLCAGSVVVGAVVGEAGVGRLQNPAGSSKIMVCTKIVANDQGAGGDHTLTVTTSNATVDLGTEVMLDRRLVGPTGAGIDFTAGQVEGYTSAVATGVVWARYPQAGNPMLWRGAVILGPGDNVNVRSANNNVALTVSYEWRERTFNPAENRLQSR